MATSSGWQGQRDFPYNHANIKADLNIYSITNNGSSLTISGEIGARGVNMQSGGSAWYDYPVFVKPENGVKQMLLSGGERVAQDQVKTVYFSVTVVNTSSSSTKYNFSVDVDMNNGTAKGTLNWTLDYNTSSAAPAINSVSNPTQTSLDVNWSTNGGDMSASFVYYSRYMGTVEGSNNYYWMLGDSATGSTTKTWTFSYGIPNRRYYFYPSSGSYDGQTKSGVTMPPQIICGVKNMYSDSAMMSCSVPAHGGEYALTIQYQVNNGSWLTAGVTVQGSGYHKASTLEFEVPNLRQNNFYTINVRATSPVGTTVGKSVTFLLEQDATGLELYGSNDLRATPITKLYGSVNGRTKLIKKLYGSVNSQSTLGFSEISSKGVIGKESFGYLIFYTDSSKTTTDFARLLSQADVNALGDASGWTKTFDGKSVKKSYIITCVIGKSATSLPSQFMQGCDGLVTLDISKASITAIPDQFAFSCPSLSSQIVIPETVTSIGTYFLGISLLRSAQASGIVIPQSVQHIGAYFLAGQFGIGTVDVGDLPATVADVTENPENTGSFCNTIVGSEVPSEIVYIKGKYASDWCARFPNYYTVVPGQYFTTVGWRKIFPSPDN